MANVPESATFDAGIYQIEITDAVIGGVNGISNLQAKGLANRTTWLKAQVDALNALKGMGIQAFSAGSSYVGGQQSIYQKNIWQANTTISPGAFNPANWTRQLGVAAESALADAVPLMDGTAAVGTSTDLAREDHVHPIDTTRAPLASPVLTGNPTGPTAPQFDTDFSLATTEFVQRALGNKQAVKTVITTPVALTTADVGKLIDCYDAASVVNLPLGSTVTPGATFLLYTAKALTLQASGGNLISPYPGAATVASISIPLGTVCEVVWNGALWRVNVQGAGILSLAKNGYQKLPSGLIIQWGQGSSGASGNLQQTLPIAFSITHFVAVASSQSESNPSLFSAVFSLTQTSIEVRVRTLTGEAANAPVSWVAFGH